MVFVVAILLLLLLRVVVGSIAETRAADQARELGNHQQAVLHYGRAIKWYFPISPINDRAVGRLSGLAVELESKGDTAAALSAWRVLKGSLHAIESFYQPFRTKLQESDQNIARLVVLLNGGVAESEAAVLATMQNRTRLHQGWAFIVPISLLGWIVSVIGFIFSGFNEEGKVRLTRRSKMLAMCALAMFGLWMLSLTQA